jgi:hypothetical protein
MWKLISGYVLCCVYNEESCPSYATFEHKQAAFTHGKHSLVLSTTCRKNSKEW